MTNSINQSQEPRERGENQETSNQMPEERAEEFLVTFSNPRLSSLSLKNPMYILNSRSKLTINVKSWTTRETTQCLLHNTARNHNLKLSQKKTQQWNQAMVELGGNKSEMPQMW